jgi:hypothetical protein
MIRQSDDLDLMISIRRSDDLDPMIWRSGDFLLTANLLFLLAANFCHRPNLTRLSA